jgi:hypothetical protein
LLTDRECCIIHRSFKKNFWGQYLDKQTTERKRMTVTSYATPEQCLEDAINAACAFLPLTSEEAALRAWDAFFGAISHSPYPHLLEDLKGKPGFKANFLSWYEKFDEDSLRDYLRFDIRK